MSKINTALVIGSGVAGPVAAMALRRAGIDAAVYEAYPRRARVEQIAAGAARVNRAKAPGPVARVLMPLLMPIVMKTVRAPERALAPVPRYTIDWDEPVTAAH